MYSIFYTCNFPQEESHGSSEGHPTKESALLAIESVLVQHHPATSFLFTVVHHDHKGTGDKDCAASNFTSRASHYS